MGGWILVLMFFAGYLVAGGLGFGLGWVAADRDGKLLKGYRYGSEDGYSIGYNDSAQDLQPSPESIHREMTPKDYDVRHAIDGRFIGE